MSVVQKRVWVAFFQTDKAVVSLEHDDDGTLAKIVKTQDSGTVKVKTTSIVVVMLCCVRFKWPLCTRLET